eukprot:TRINITY_DN6726_c1_g1_i3.p1 TRINITY_DN6726_c1_g1~~TRINITY_DN6726_c1_g1_i3.p1  ORF type:complete len:357 (-),score=18.75 TRINITY_DN6726_c1_g1_i3:167-1237(-)
MDQSLRLISATGGGRDAGQRPPDIKLQRVQFTDMIEHLFEPPTDEIYPTKEELICKIPLVLCTPRFILVPRTRIQCPAHDPIDVIAATLFMLENPTCTNQQLIEIIKTPSFRQGGFILQNEKIADFYTQGFAEIDMVARSQVITPDNNNQSNFVIKFTGIPYLSFSHIICRRIRTLMNGGKLPGVYDAWVQSDVNEALTVCVSVIPSYQAQIYNIIQDIYQKSSIRRQMPMSMYACMPGEEHGQHWDLQKLLTCWMKQRIKQIQQQQQCQSEQDAKQKIIQELQCLKQILIQQHGYSENRKIIGECQQACLLGLPEDMRQVVDKRLENQLKIDSWQSQKTLYVLRHTIQTMYQSAN